jgi:hypothetical protein
MSRYQLRDPDGTVVGEESFDSFESADAWAQGSGAPDGWTLFQQIGGQWTAARLDPTELGDAPQDG